MNINRDALLHEITGFLGTDLLCYRAPSDNPETKALSCNQAQTFAPILNWVAQQFNAAFVVTESLMPIPQNAASIAALRQEFAAANDAALLALAELTGLLGSALLAFAVWKGQITLDQALAASRLDEQHAADRYGLDPTIEAKWRTQETRVQTLVALLG